MATSKERKAAEQKDREIAALIMRMLDNLDLKGSDVPAFIEVKNWLHAITEK